MLLSTQDYIAIKTAEVHLSSIMICICKGHGDFNKGLQIIKNKLESRKHESQYHDLKVVIEIIEEYGDKIDQTGEIYLKGVECEKY